MSTDIGTDCLQIRSIEPEELFHEQKIELDISNLASYDLISPSKLLSSDDVWLIKNVKAQGKKVYVAKDERKYVELRGGEWEIALTIVGESIKVIVLGLISRWIYDKVKNWKKEKEENSPSSGIEQPRVKIGLYFTKTKKHVELEGDADSVLKALDKLKKDDI